MRFSVITPCYNAGPWIGQALRSAQRQTHHPHEIIVIDDGSTDDSVEQIRATGVGVRLLHTERANGAGARNVGIEAATGDWIAFLDADDLWYDNHLERAADLLSKASDVAYIALIDRINLRDEISKVPGTWKFGSPVTGLTHYDFADMYSECPYFGMVSIVVRRDRLLEIGGFDTSLVRRHDFDMWLRLIYQESWCYDPIPSAAWRSDSPGSISRNKVNCDYFLLRACVKNLDLYNTPSFQAITEFAAQRAMASAYTDGDVQDQERAEAIAWPHLRRMTRVIFKLFRVWPKGFSFLNKCRRVLNRTTRLSARNLAQRGTSKMPSNTIEP